MNWPPCVRTGKKGFETEVEDEAGEWGRGIAQLVEGLVSPCEETGFDSQ